MLQTGTAPNVRATGVQFKNAANTGSTLSTTAGKVPEVIPAAGAIGTPQLLQVSGIGDPAVLQPLGITPVVSLKTVDRDLQEQTMNSSGYAGSFFNPGGSGPSDVIVYPSFSQFLASSAGGNGPTTPSQIASQIMPFYPAWVRLRSNNAHDDLWNPS